MNIKAADRTLIAKPFASRPTISDLRSFSGATNGSPSLEPPVAAIRPKMVIPIITPPPVEMVSSQAELTGTQACNLSDKIFKSNCTSPLLYKPISKTVSRTTISHMVSIFINSQIWTKLCQRGMGGGLQCI
ncbi:hypothetical protein L1987_08105 [Smallanthus sonchifolius]|uniref:Uncharacterized protein n=1 Tax=Smallanthus sonchifolius TaxID=185202 RepID=A0ACB9JMS5_9ASTR|nr:hypothetical protein L1987_08105 [Smallanthus sonchifolius]